tara:strand:- start:4 stop:480 length:477 start_codon:yes stop_codon:yes gene_type:complete
MEFEIYGHTLKYDDGIFYRLWEYSCKRKFKPPVWKEIKPTKKDYVYFTLCNNYKKKTILVHRVVYWLHNPHWDLSDTSMFVDHIDRNKHNNDIDNLRLVTPEENCFNTNAKGCSFRKDVGKWTAYIRVKKKLKHLGFFELEEDAHQAYLDAKKIYHII